MYCALTAAAFTPVGIAAFAGFAALSGVSCAASLIAAESCGDYAAEFSQLTRHIRSATGGFKQSVEAFLTTFERAGAAFREMLLDFEVADEAARRKHYKQWKHHAESLGRSCSITRASLIQISSDVKSLSGGCQTVAWIERHEGDSPYLRKLAEDLGLVAKRPGRLFRPVVRKSTVRWLLGFE